MIWINKEKTSTTPHINIHYLLCKANILRFYSFLNLTAGDAYTTQYVAPKWAHLHVRVCPWRKNLQADIKNNLMHALPKIIFQIILIENRFF